MDEVLFGGAGVFGEPASADAAKNSVARLEFTHAHPDSLDHPGQIRAESGHFGPPETLPQAHDQGVGSPPKAPAKREHGRQTGRTNWARVNRRVGSS